MEAPVVDDGLLIELIAGLSFSRAHHTARWSKRGFRQSAPHRSHLRSFYLHPCSPPVMEAKRKGFHRETESACMSKARLTSYIRTPYIRQYHHSAMRRWCDAKHVWNEPKHVPWWLCCIYTCSRTLRFVIQTNGTCPLHPHIRRGVLYECPLTISIPALLLARRFSNRFLCFFLFPFLIWGEAHTHPYGSGDAAECSVEASISLGTLWRSIESFRIIRYIPAKPIEFIAFFSVFGFRFLFFGFLLAQRSTGFVPKLYLPRRMEYCTECVHRNA